ncbi:MAG: GNAT family N-acetyltransferase [Candidatus Limnocylindrales bacterium]
MTTVAAGRGIVARQSTDRAALRGFLERDRIFAAYAVCDLDEREFGRARWAVAMAGNQLVAVGMEYTGPTPQSMFVLGHNDGIAAILRDVLRPRAAYISAAAPALPALAQSYRIEPGPAMVRMAVGRATFRPYPAPVERLLPVEVGELNRLYQLGFAAWLPSGAVAEGVYFGVRVAGRLVAAAGTHVISREARMGVVGNVMTHAEYRNRGLAKAVTSAVTAELLRYCDDVVLNVRSDNPPAIAAYQALGYEEHCRFEERLIRRTAPAWPSIPAPFRRFFGSRPAQDAQLTYDQAHPMTPPVDASPEPVDADPVADPPDPIADLIAPDSEPSAGPEPGRSPEEPQ